MTDAPSEDSKPLSAVLADELVAYRAGDQSAAGRLVRRATPLLWHLARSHGADAVTAEDAVQNALLALVRYRDRIDEPRAVLQWLIVTVRREVTRLGTVAGRVDLLPEFDERPADDERAAPESAQLTSERDQVLWAAVATLSARCQQLLRVIAFADRPDYAAISAALGMRMGSIGPTRGRCLAKLRALLTADPAWSCA